MSKGQCSSFLYQFDRYPQFFHKHRKKRLEKECDGRRTFIEKCLVALALTGFVLLTGCAKKEIPAGLENQDKLWEFAVGQKKAEEPLSWRTRRIRRPSTGMPPWERPIRHSFQGQRRLKLRRFVGDESIFSPSPFYGGGQGGVIEEFIMEGTIHVIWNWIVAIDLFGAGLSAGAFIISATATSLAERGMRPLQDRSVYCSLPVIIGILASFMISKDRIFSGIISHLPTQFGNVARIWLLLFFSFFSIAHLYLWLPRDLII